ncbi:acetylcholinesterase [Xylariomycetidae sp. FL2044]|nr:acetylcholinesterase [Xylariomycetidae sp. FL2044]
MRHFAALSTPFLAASAAIASPTAYDATRGVTYQGLERDGIEMFINIPFGQDTGGANRFRPPVPFVPAANSTVVAQEEGPACPQALNALTGPNALSNVTFISEDCLNLNVGRPRGTKEGDALPVMVFIYGGGFWVGFDNDLRQAPGGLVQQSVANGMPVIDVNFNYRLGVFGFAKSDALQAEGSTNAGLRDQRLALEWVRDNIAHFGGDPSRVTIFGQSSGGLAVGMQIMAYGGERPVPFQRAICESQALEPGITGNFTSDAWARVVEYTNCSGAATGGRGGEGGGGGEGEEDLDCLRALDTQALYDASEATFQGEVGDNIGDIWLPAVDGDFLPAAPSALVREGRFAGDLSAVAVGWCEDDLAPFTDRSIATEADTRAFMGAYLPGMRGATLDALLALYPSGEFAANATAGLSAQFYRAARIWRDVLMVCMPVGFAEAIAKKKNNNNNNNNTDVFAEEGKTSVYLYDWNQTVLGPAYDAAGRTGVGVFHTADLEYVFGNLSVYNHTPAYPFAPSAADYALAGRGSRSWSTFATLGRPGLEGHDTFVGWAPAFPDAGAEEEEEDQMKETWSVFVAGGPHEGLSAVDGDAATEEIARQRLGERCAFLNSDEVIAQLNY